MSSVEGGEAQQSEKAAAKAAKKAAEKAAKEAAKAEREKQLAEQREAAASVLSAKVTDVEQDIFGTLPSTTENKRTGRVWTDIGSIVRELADQRVWIRARVSESRAQSKTMIFLVLRWRLNTIQAIMTAQSEEEKQAVKFLTSLPLESIVDIYGKVVVPPQPILTTTQEVEISIERCHCVSRATNDLPFQLKDANRPETEKAAEDGSEFVVVNPETRLDNRVLDFRTFAMQAVLRVSSEVCSLFREFLRGRRFVEIHTPKLMGGSSEGGSNVFTLKYFGSPACLAQSPQLHKQMAIAGDLEGVFEIGPVFRAENSNTHRHLCEFTGLDMEMSFKEHYFEVLEVIEQMFTHIFKGLNERCKREIEVVSRQWPSEPFKFSEEGKVLRLTFSEGCDMLRAASFEVPEDISQFDINTEQEKALGRLVRAKYDTDFYYMINYPLAVRPFYTMPLSDDPTLSNSYDFFMRGEEILSGAQRIHNPEFLTGQARKAGIDVSTLKSYIDSFKLGAHPHAGCGVGLERVVMLFLGLNNIRKTAMFPRDPKRISP